MVYTQGGVYQGCGRVYLRVCRVYLRVGRVYLGCTSEWCIHQGVDGVSLRNEAAPESRLLPVSLLVDTLASGLFSSFPVSLLASS